MPGLTQLIVPVCLPGEATDRLVANGLDPARLPQNLAALAGDDVTITCWAANSSIHARVQWSEYAYLTDGYPNLISDNEYVLGHPQAARYSIVHDEPNQYDLRIKNITLADGGKYSCREVLAVSNEITHIDAELVVIRECFWNKSEERAMTQDFHSYRSCLLIIIK